MSLNRTLLIKLLGRLGSEFAAERDTAARMVDEMIGNSGQNWAQLLESESDSKKALAQALRENELLKASLAAALARQRQYQPPDEAAYQQTAADNEYLQFALARRHRLNDWEREFLQSVAQLLDNGIRLSDKQTDRLNYIIGKLKRGHKFGQ